MALLRVLGQKVFVLFVIKKAMGKSECMFADFLNSIVCHKSNKFVLASF